jgi:hypothetical protein
MFESKSGIFYIAGIGFFVLAFVSNALVPWLMYNDIPEKTVAELINPNLRYQFEDLARRYPEAFEAAYGNHLAAMLNMTRGGMKSVATLCELATRFMWVKAAGTATVSSFVRSLTKSNAGAPCRDQPSIRMSCSDQCCSELAELARTCAGKVVVDQTTGMQCTSISRTACLRNLRCRSIRGSLMDLQISQMPKVWRS